MAVRLLADTGQRLQYRHVRFARAILLDTLAAADSNNGLLSDRIQETSDKCSLANAGLARDEYNSTLSLQHLGKPAAQLLQLGLAADHDRHRASRNRWGLERRVRCGRGCDGCNKAVTPPMHRLDKARGREIIAQGFTQLSHADTGH